MHEAGTQHVRERADEPVRGPQVPGQSVTVEATITLQAHCDEVYSFARDLGNLSRWMPHLSSVTPTEAGRWHIVAAAPSGSGLEWVTEIISAEEPHLIAWRSIGNAEVSTAGVLHLEPGAGGGTQVRLSLNYVVQPGTPASIVEIVCGADPRQRTEDDLRRFQGVIAGQKRPVVDVAGPSGSSRSSKTGGVVAPMHDDDDAIDADDRVGEASQESFPASDPPGWTRETT